MTLLVIAAAAALGAATRYTVDYTVIARTGGHLPWGTFTVNVTGSFAIGILVGLVLSGVIAPEHQLPLGTGFLGAYTTFSTWMFETVRLIEQRAWRPALANGVGSLILGPLATIAGLCLATLA
jgi:fluoride exporter